MSKARHVRFLETETKVSRLILARTLDIPLREHGRDTDQINVKILPSPDRRMVNFAAQDAPQRASSL